MTTEDMIRNLKRVVALYKDKPVYTGEINIMCMCQDVINHLKELNEKTKWHTGTPTEDGDYIIAFHPWGRKENKICYKGLIWKDDHWFDPATEYKTEPYLVAWQRIEPYKEKTE